MAIDKGSPVTIFSSQSLAAAATLTGDWIDWTEKQAMTVFIKITQGGTATGTRPAVTIEVADDIAGTNNVEVFNITTPNVINDVTDLIHYHAITDRFVRVIIVNGTAEAITVAAHAHLVDNLG